ncbi:hypothetical protein NL317_29605, partial [Klebsiella pneumoniae]|nr:hypothetical protein [Klebsiella pneumoniae]
MKLLATDFQWRLQSFDVKNGRLKPVEVPLHGGSQQTFAVHRGGIPAGTLHLDAGDLARSRNGE